MMISFSSSFYWRSLIGSRITLTADCIILKYLKQFITESLLERVRHTELVQHDCAHLAGIIGFTNLKLEAEVGADLRY